jgi:spermidine dehydrogenase
MDRKITRRDFLNGVSLGLAGATMIGPQTLLAEAVRKASGISSAYYPPALTGMRGDHEGSFEVSHALAWRGKKPSRYTDLEETYDLVVVGAGISGLAAACIYQQKAGKSKRILLLDNHDDFGGHATRNEFYSQDRLLLGVGGCGNLQDSKRYSAESRKLIEDLGFDLDELRKKVDPKWPLTDLSQSVGMYTDRKHFGKDVIINGRWLPAWHGVGNYQELVAGLPLPEPERKKLIQFIEGSRPLEKQLPAGDIRDTLRRTSYKEFLTEYVGLSELTCRLFNPIMILTYCVELDSLSVYEGFKTGLPGLSVLGREAMGVFDEAELPQDSDIVWMPDGNASLTRQMVRRLIPGVAAGETMSDLVDARFDYGRLDRTDQPVRLRLNSTVVNAANSADGSVSISYVKQGEAYSVKARHCILACYNSMIPDLCPELSEEQKSHLRYGVKMPFISVNVLLRNGRAFNDAGGQLYLCPTSYFKMVTKSPPVSIGNYEPTADPDSPMLIYMLTAPTQENDGSQTARDLYRDARYELLTTSFEDFEHIIREQLAGMFGATGFDADRDIEAITVNRWAHGYTYYYLSMFDPEWPEGEAPHELGRKQFGRISIANCDSEGHAYVDGAIDAAWRAVNEQLGNG